MLSLPVVTKSLLNESLSICYCPYLFIINVVIPSHDQISLKWITVHMLLLHTLFIINVVITGHNKISLKWITVHVLLSLLIHNKCCHNPVMTKSLLNESLSICYCPYLFIINVVITSHAQISLKWITVHMLLSILIHNKCCHTQSWPNLS